MKGWYKYIIGYAIIAALAVWWLFSYHEVNEANLIMYDEKGVVVDTTVITNIKVFTTENNSIVDTIYYFYNTENNHNKTIDSKLYDFNFKSRNTILVTPKQK